MPKTQRMKFGEFIGLLTPDQEMMLCVDCLEKHMVTGTADAIGYITSSDVNNMFVCSVMAMGKGLLRVWVKDENDDVSLISMEGYK